MTVSKPAAPWDAAVIAAINILDASDILDEHVGVLAMLDEDDARDARFDAAAAGVVAQIVYIRRRLDVVEAEVKRLLGGTS